MKNTHQFIYLIALLIILQFTGTSCSRKSYPESTPHENITKTATNPTTTPSHNHTKIKSDSNTTTSTNPNTKHDEVTDESYEIKTTNKELNNFLNHGYGKALNVGETTPEDLIKTARKYLGTPHRMGGTSLKGIDCSGFVMMSFADNGISMPHNSEEQARYGKVITDKSKLKEGDLVFFVNSYKTSKYITHAGIYLGNNQFMHTSSSKGVTITSLDDSWWKDKFIFGTRVF